MAQVEQRYGAPATRLGAVGQSPRSRAMGLSSFVVFFEGNIVIHAVASPPATSGERPNAIPATSVGLLTLQPAAQAARTLFSNGIS